MAMQKEKAEIVLNKVVEVLKKELNPEKIILFGSRAKEKSAPYSDIDLAIEGAPVLNLRELRRLKEKVEAISWLFL